MPSLPALRKPIPHAVGWLALALGFSLPISTALDNVLFAAIMALWLAAGDWRAKLARLRASPPALAILLLLALTAAGMMWGGGSGSERWRYFGKYANLLLALCLLTLPLARPLRLRAFAGFGLAILVTVTWSYGIYSGLVPDQWIPADQVRENPVVFKAQITHGFFVAVGCFVFVVGALHARHQRWRWLLYIGAAVAAGNVLITHGRTGYLVLAVLAAYLFIERFRWRGALLSGVAIATMALTAQQFPESAVMARVTKGIGEVQRWEYGREDSTSMGERLQFAATSLRIIADHPVIGVGTGGFEDAYRDKIADTQARVSNNPHNQYLLTTVQLGVHGLLALLAVFGILWHTSRNLPPPERTLARGLLLAYMVGNLFNSFHYDHAEALFFAWSMGLLFCGTRSTDTAGPPDARLSPRS